MALVTVTYPSFINLAGIEREPLINTSIHDGVGKVIKEPYIPDWFKELEQKILHDPIHSWKPVYCDYVWKKDNRGIWIQCPKVERSYVFWDPKKDGSHVKPAQAWFTKNNEKRIIPARTILDDNYGKNKKRNDTIEKNRDKYLSKYKKGRGNYENLGNYYYKSQHDKELFLKEVEDLGLVRKTEKKKSTVEIGPREYYRGYMSNRYQEDEL